MMILRGEPMKPWPLFCAAIVTASASPLGINAEPPKFSVEQLRQYEADVLPILKANCYECHGIAKPKGSLSLAAREAILQGGDSGPAVDLQNSDARLL